MLIKTTRRLDGKADLLEGVALVDPVTGMPVPVGSVAVASDGTPFSANGPVAYAYNLDGTISTMTLTDGASIYRQTWVWTAGQLTSTSAWVKQ